MGYLFIKGLNKQVEIINAVSRKMYNSDSTHTLSIAREGTINSCLCNLVIQLFNAVYAKLVLLYILEQAARGTIFYL